MGPPKRKSLTQGDKNGKAARSSDLHVPVDALLKEPVQKFDQWWCLGGGFATRLSIRAAMITKHKSVDSYFKATIGEEAKV